MVTTLLVFYFSSEFLQTISVSKTLLIYVWQLVISCSIKNVLHVLKPNFVELSEQLRSSPFS